MRAGDKVTFWSYQGIDDGDVHTGTLLAIQGNTATIKEGTRNVVINKNWIFETWTRRM